jgi:hypothetical protein
MTINAGDIVASNGRIITMHGDRRRHISFERATVLAINGDQITINPAGMRVTLVAQQDDLTTEITADEQVMGEIPVSGTSTRPPKPTERVQTPSPPPEVVQRSKPKLSALHVTPKVVDTPKDPPHADRPVPKRRASKAPARRRKPQ